MNGQREETINLLTQLGLTEYESRVYLSLLEKHPSSAYGISQISGVPHSRVYDIARRLMRKGLIRSSGMNPARFSPLAPEELIARLTRERERIITDLGGRLKSYAFEGEPEPVWNIPVRSEALDTAARLVGQAQRSVYISLWDEEVPALSVALREGFSKTANVYVLIHGKAELDFGNVYHHSGPPLLPFGERPAGIRAAGGWTGPARIRTLNCSVDSSVCIAGSLYEGEACRMVWTRNPGVVGSIEESIIRSLYLTEIERALGPALVDAYGEQLIALTELFKR